jgi:hypothetical protein
MLLARLCHYLATSRQDSIVTPRATLVVRRFLGAPPSANRDADPSTQTSLGVRLTEGYGSLRPV